MRVQIVDFKHSKAQNTFCNSLVDTGFAVLTNHPIPVVAIKKCYQQWRGFFESEDKFNYLYQKPSQDGYFPLRTETAKNHTHADLKEFYHFYQWGKIPESLKAISIEMCHYLLTLATTLLSWTETQLPKNIASQLSMPLAEMIKDSPNTLLRILHYPPLTDVFSESAVRAAPHEDINLLTLLPAATTPGLEVLDAKGKWHQVNCDPGNIVVNVGDMLQMCTQYYYRSTTHRVVNPIKEDKNISRYSMPFFLHPRPEVSLAENITAENYLTERLTQIGIY